MKLIDTHSHVDMLEELGYDNVIAKAKEFFVEKIIVPSADEKSIQGIMNLASNYKNVFVALGIHPEEVLSWNDEVLDTIRNIAKTNSKVVAIGEIGLDYYWDKEHIQEQKNIFVKQIELANELNLPIIVHDREAHFDSLTLLKEHNKGNDVIFHCFSGSKEFMKECLNEGYYIGLGGVVTFKNAKKVKEIAKLCPLDRLLLETDAPYMTPVPHRGETNEPAYVKFVAEEIAKLREMPVEELAKVTTDNAERVFGI